MKHLLLIGTLLITMFANVANAKIDSDNEPQEIDNSIVIDRITNNDIQVIIPSLLFTFSEAEITIKFVNPDHTKLLLNKNKIEFIINGENKILNFNNGEASFKHSFKGSKNLSIYVEDFSYNKQLTVYPLWAIIIPIVLIILFLLKRIIKK